MSESTLALVLESYACDALQHVLLPVYLGSYTSSSPRPLLKPLRVCPGVQGLESHKHRGCIHLECVPLLFQVPQICLNLALPQPALPSCNIRHWTHTQAVQDSRWTLLPFQLVKPSLSQDELLCWMVKELNSNTKGLDFDSVSSKHTDALSWGKQPQLRPT